MSEQIVTADVYESCFYLLAGCSIEAVEGIPVNGKINCRLRFTGPEILQKQAEYFSGKAQVNLFELRRAYSQVCGWIAEAKRKINRELVLKGAGTEGNVMI
jgi:hypothetical protein